MQAKFEPHGVKGVAYTEDVGVALLELNAGEVEAILFLKM